jgi:tetratricopeptide (TPR) repeat protein
MLHLSAIAGGGIKMNTYGKYVPIVIAIIGAIAGIWGAYTAYDASKFKQPFDEHSQIANSYNSQIASAEARKDSTEANRLRLQYEKFEEGWRNGLKIQGLVAPLESLASTELDTKDVAKVKSLLSSASSANNLHLSSKTLGTAYFAIGDYENAIRHLKDASARNDDPQALALQSAAFGKLATTASTENKKVSYENSAVTSFRAAQDSPSAKSLELSGFVKGNTALKAILDVKGVAIATSLSKPTGAPVAPAHAPVQ